MIIRLVVEEVHFEKNALTKKHAMLPFSLQVILTFDLTEQMRTVCPKTVEVVDKTLVPLPIFLTLHYSSHAFRLHQSSIQQLALMTAAASTRSTVSPISIVSLTTTTTATTTMVMMMKLKVGRCSSLPCPLLILASATAMMSEMEEILVAVEVAFPIVVMHRLFAPCPPFRTALQSHRLQFLAFQLSSRRRNR